MKALQWGAFFVGFPLAAFGSAQAADCALIDGLVSTAFDCAQAADCALIDGLALTVLRQHSGSGVGEVQPERSRCNLSGADAT